MVVDDLPLDLELLGGEPGLLERLAQCGLAGGLGGAAGAAGDAPGVAVVAPGGAVLEQHSGPGATTSSPAAP